MKHRNKLTTIALLCYASPMSLAAGITWKPLCEPGSGGMNTSAIISPFDSKRMLTGGDMLGIGLSTDGGKTWQSTFGLKCYEMGDLTWHPKNPNIVWTGSVGGAWISLDGGVNWQERRTGMPGPEFNFGYKAPIEKVIFDPQNDKRLLAVGGSSRRWDFAGGTPPGLGAIWESIDEGASWKRLTTITPDGASDKPDAKGANIVGLAWSKQAPFRIYITVADTGLFVSEDKGKTWVKRMEGIPHRFVERVVAHPKNPDTAWVVIGCKGDAKPVTPGGVFKTIDGGKHWVSISNGLAQNSNEQSVFASNYKALGVCESNPDVMYTSDPAWNTGTLYVTKDGGKNWTLCCTKQNVGTDDKDPKRMAAFHVKVAYPAGIGEPVMTVDPHNPNVCLAVGSEEMLITRDGGKTWESASSYPSPTVPGAFKGRGFSGLCAMNFRFNPQKPGHALLLAMDAGKCWETTDNLQSWTFHGSDPWPWGGGNEATFSGNHIYFTTGQFNSFMSVVRTKDGKKWETLQGKEHGLPGFNDHGSTAGIYALPNDPTKVWAVINGLLYASTDEGDHWTIIHRGPNFSGIAGDPRKPNVFYVSGEKNVYRTEDGKKFQPIGGPHQAGRMAVDSLGRLLIAADQAERGGLWRWDGKSWTRLWDDKWIKNVAVDPKNPKRLLFTTSTDPYMEYGHGSGVWASVDDGITFTQINDGLAMLRGHAIAFDPFNTERMIFGSFGRGFFVGNWPKGYLPTGGKGYTSTADDVKYATIDPTPEPGDPAKKAVVIKNGSMTDGTDTPDGWMNSWTGRGKIKVTRDTSVFKVGPASYCISTEGADGMGQSGQQIDGVAGQKFTLSGWAKSQGKCKVNVAVQCYNGGWNPVSFIQAFYLQDDTDWTEFSKEITLPDGTEHFNILALIDGTGKAWLDEVKVK